MRTKTKVLLATIWLTLCGLSPMTAVATSPEDLTCIAHRGGNQWTPAHTEETAATYASAVAAGVTWVEGDIRWSSTNYPYLSHNADLGLFGQPTVLLANVSGTVAAGYTSASGDHVMSLYELREQLVASPAVHAQLELKTALTEPQWSRLASRLDPIRGRVMITSFSKDTVQAAQVHGYRTGLLSSVAEGTAEAPTFVLNYAALNSGDVAAHASVGVETQVWTVDSSVEWAAAAAVGATAVITNDPVGCMVWSATP